MCQYGESVENLSHTTSISMSPNLQTLNQTNYQQIPKNLKPKIRNAISEFQPETIYLLQKK